MVYLVLVEGGRLKPAFNEFFADYFTPPPFNEDKFIAIVRALEVLHRRMRTIDYYMPKEQYHKTLLKKFNELIDKALLNEEFQESLKKWLSCGYQYSLSTRLEDLFTAYGTEFLTLFVGKNKRGSFARS